MRTPLRIGLFYASIFAGTGASLPYISLWFRDHGLSGAQIGMILSAPMLARIIVGPVLAVWADGFTLRRTPMMLMGLGAAMAFATIAFTHGVWAWLIAWTLAACLQAGMAPLCDVLTLRLGRREGFTYGFPRGIGSVAFVGANLIVGALLNLLGTGLVLIWTVATALGSGISARLALPAEPVHLGGERPGRRDRWRGLGDLLRNPVFMLMIISAGLIQSTHAFYYGFSSLIWKQQGVPSSVIGLLWATGVGAEIAFMWFAEPLRRRLGPERMILLGGLSALIRWTAGAFSPPLILLFPLQALHAFSFTATFMGSLQLIEKHAPPHAASAGQTLASALSGGLFIGLATMASGPLFDHFGVRGYFGMSVMTLIGLAGVVWLMRIGKSAKPSLASDSA